jgi:uncharacterized protein CbrC (UPF0167 family)
MAGDDKKPGTNINPAATDCLTWNNSDVEQSLKALRAYVEGETQKTIDWYWREKEPRKLMAQKIQLRALILTAAAGLVPVVVQILRPFISPYFPAFSNFDSGSIATLLVGLAAAAIGMDKAFGYSSGWTRYVLTGTALSKLLAEFRMDCVTLEAQKGDDRAANLIRRAKDFVSAVQSALLQETKDWAAEFQSNVAGMEKDIKAQLDALKSQVEKTVKERDDATRPGAIVLAVVNAEKTDNLRFEVCLEGGAGKVSEIVEAAREWTRINVVPGQYKVTVTAAAHGSPVAASTIVQVKAGETQQSSITLNIA